MRNYFLGLCLLFALCFTACSHSDDSVDVLIIGGGASGVTAGIQSARMGAATLIVEETEWLGGMLTSAGVSAVDGNYDLPAGLFGEFREHLADYYVNLIEMTREEREEALKYAKHYTMCFVYFLQHELGFNTLGLADDEYPTADKLPFIPYHRESRRIHGLVRFDLNHACEPFRQSQPLYRTCIAVGNYPVDHHHTRYHGYEELPNLYFHPIPSYGLPLGTLIPKDVEGLIVAEKSISVSNIINGTTRLQPMVMQIGQAAGALAALAVKEDKNIREVSVREVQNAILDGKGYLLPYLDVELDHPMFKSLQRIGSTGILKGIGKSVDWSNQMWFRADTLLLANELKGLGDVYPFVNKQIFEGNNTISIQKATELIRGIAEKEGFEMKEGRVEEIWNEFELKDFDMNRGILRSEMAILIDQILDPFNNKKVDITGQYIQ